MAGDLRRDVVVIGASYGGVDALRRMVSRFPADLPASVLVVLHIAPGHKSVLPDLLAWSGPLPAKHAEDREPLRHGQIYVAPPDVHLLVEDGGVRLLQGPRENNVRPAIDPLFRSAARSHGPRVIACVLTGLLDCGSSGLVAVKRRGGLAFVQDPDEAVAPSMPRAAIDAVTPDLVASVESLAAAIDSAVREPFVAPSPPPADPALAEGQDDAVESALWAAVRAFDESAALARRLARRARDAKRLQSARAFDERAKEHESKAAVLRTLVQGTMQPSGVDPVDAGAEPDPRP